MKKALVLGAKGFIGKNLIEGLSRYKKYITILTYDIDDSYEKLEKTLSECDIIYHVAGVNRPKDPIDFIKGNTEFTSTICNITKKHNNKAPIIFISSIQALLDNPYGVSKKKAEDILIKHASENKSNVYIYRLTNVFGKWSRPNYNSVVATFCYNISHNLKVEISDPSKNMTFLYIDDVVNEFLSYIMPIIEAKQPETPNGEVSFKDIEPKYTITLGELFEKIKNFKTDRDKLLIPDLTDKFTRYLYATYLSYNDFRNITYSPPEKNDERGMLCELLKSPSSGQIFISRTKPNITRGNHYHNTKVEKFCVISGEAEIKFRHIITNEIYSIKVSGRKITIVDIPPGYTHSITNTGNTELITLFWASEMFDPNNPDTYFEEVNKK